MVEKKYKYIHILFTTMTGWGFVKSLLDTINNETNGFNPDNHLFVTSDELLYQKMQSLGYSNSILQIEEKSSHCQGQDPRQYRQVKGH